MNRRFSAVRLLAVLIAVSSAVSATSRRGFAQDSARSDSGPGADAIESTTVTVRIESDVSYKPDAETPYEQARCKLDWYLPVGKPEFPTIVWFHGVDYIEFEGRNHSTIANQMSRADDAVAHAIQRFIRQ